MFFLFYFCPTKKIITVIRRFVKIWILENLYDEKIILKLNQKKFLLKTRTRRQNSSKMASLYIIKNKGHRFWVMT
jgi:hypothetical protein